MTLTIPKGWKWFKAQGRIILQQYSSAGVLTDKLWLAAYDPSDEEEILRTGDFNAAEARGTAKQFTFSHAEMAAHVSK